MRYIILFLTCLLCGVLAKDPTLYEHYTSGGIKSGLEAKSADTFHLNGKPFVIYGGSFHYFRVVPQHWRQMLQRYKAAGLNAVQLYLPWNLHEDTPGKFDFASAGLHLAAFLEEIKLADMFAIVRPGPYICAEWDLGGFPSWLLRDPNLKIRTNYAPYMKRVKLFWDEALKIINRYQFSTSGGPVILLQIENEYSSWIHRPASDEYLNFLVKIVRDSGFKELLFNSDPGDIAQGYPIKDIYKDHSILQAANLNQNSTQILTQLKKNQPGKPAFISEFWPGQADMWSDRHHHTYSVDKFTTEVSDTLFAVNGSINFYMFLGGTNFGFSNGARVTTSYDFDAPLTEAGNYTAKYAKTRELYLKLVASGRLPKTLLPDVPPAPKTFAYGNVTIAKILPFEALLEQTVKLTNQKRPLPMELLPLGPDYGQRFGFIVYRVEGKADKSYQVNGTVRDHRIFVIDGAHYHSVVSVEGGSVSIAFPTSHHGTPANGSQSSFRRIDLMVENGGRVNTGQQMAHDRKGILEGGDILLDGRRVENITIYSLDFNRTFVERLGQLKSWIDVKNTTHHGPALFRSTLKVTQTEPQDTYLLLDGWSKGNVFVNDFNVGRYYEASLQKTLYIPGPLLKMGLNTIDVFEQYGAGEKLQFIDTPIFK